MENKFRTNAENFTQARVGLGYSGGSISTKDVLKFRYDHASARDAVWKDCNWDLFANFFIPTIRLHSLAKDRSEYLLRPDLGRRLDNLSIQNLQAFKKEKFQVSISLADGLSPWAVERNGFEFLELVYHKLKLYKLSPLFLVSQGRVALGDEISDILDSTLHIQIIGERPGLTSADSLGIYITYSAKIGTTDERRNCISNVRPDGYSFKDAVEKLEYLVNSAFINKVTGVMLKDRMGAEIEEKEISNLLSNNFDDEK
ncbi:ethanolamine ammonia-lyase subunit EutC [Leptospira sp. 96542]|nr:ethanolamine ammonia-lyase subunit EutC [Leptospira sp. 96542]